MIGVGQLAASWNRPLTSPSSTKTELTDKTIYKTLTRIQPTMVRKFLNPQEFVYL